MEKKTNTKTKQNKFTQNDVNAILRAGSIIIGGLIISLTVLYVGGVFGSSGSSTTKNTATESGECTGDNRLAEGCYVTYAEDLDLDVSEFEQCIQEERYNDVIDREIAAGNDTGVTGTPSIYIGKGSGDVFDGFFIGSARYQDIELLVNQLKDSDIETVNANWKKLLNDSLDSYESELRSYFQSEQGGSLTGKELNDAIDQAISEQKANIESDYQLKKLSKGDGYQLGDAEIVLLEFSDYECPFCYSFAKDVLAQVKTDMVDEGEIRYIFRDFPLENIHPEARPAANAARCAGEQGKYFEYHDKLFSI